MELKVLEKDFLTGIVASLENYLIECEGFRPETGEYSIAGNKNREYLFNIYIDCKTRLKLLGGLELN